MAISAHSASRLYFGDVAVNERFMMILDSRLKKNLLIFVLGLESLTDMMGDRLAWASMTM